MNRVVGIERGGNHTGVEAAIGALPPRSPAPDAHEQRFPRVDEVGPIRRDMEGPSHDVADEYRKAMRDLTASVTIVTTRCGNEIHGMTASAVCCVSLAPPLLLVCIAKSTRTHQLITKGRVFAVHLLHQAQRELADRFAGRLLDCDNRFHGLDVGQAVTGAPVLRDSLAYLDCRVTTAHDGGDHTIFLGAVEDVGRRELDRPLIYLQGAYVDLDGQPALASLRIAGDGDLPRSFVQGGQR
jgi:flavin reductase (DIM6/NTAB) family NADH-FMN oxidoreductase RutF